MHSILPNLVINLPDLSHLAVSQLKELVATKVQQTSVGFYSQQLT